MNPKNKCSDQRKIIHYCLRLITVNKSVDVLLKTNNRKRHFEELRMKIKFKQVKPFWAEHTNGRED